MFNQLNSKIMKNVWNSSKRIVYVALLLCGIGVNLGLEYSNSGNGLTLRDLDQQLFAGGETVCYGGGGSGSFPTCQPGCPYALVDTPTGLCTF